MTYSTDLAALRERLELAKVALVGTGYFTPDQIGDDIAPRITELWSGIHARIEGLCDHHHGIPRPWCDTFGVPLSDCPVARALADHA